MRKQKGKHYHLIVVTVGKSDFDRIYFEMTDPAESPESGLVRWIESHPTMQGRVRNLDRQRAKLRASVESVRPSHPSSWWREQRETPGYVPAGRNRSRRRGA